MWVLDLKFHLSSRLYVLFSFTYLAFKNVMHIHSVYCSYLSPFPSNLSPTPTAPSQLHTLLFFLFPLQLTESNKYCLYVLVFRVIHNYTGNLREATWLKKTDSPPAAFRNVSCIIIIFLQVGQSNSFSYLLKFLLDSSTFSFPNLSLCLFNCTLDKQLDLTFQPGLCLVRNSQSVYFFQLGNPSFY